MVGHILAEGKEGAVQEALVIAQKSMKQYSMSNDSKLCDMEASLHLLIASGNKQYLWTHKGEIGTLLKRATQSKSSEPRFFNQYISFLLHFDISGGRAHIDDLLYS